MAQEQLDVFKIFGDLKKKITGIDPKTQKEPAGFFLTMNEQPEPVSKEDYDNPLLLTGTPARPYSESTEGKTPEEVEEAKTAYLNRSREARRKLNVLVDRIPEIDPKFQNIYGSARISDAWQAIVKGATGVSETMQLKPEIKAMLDKATSILKPDSPEYLAYKEYEAKFRAAQTKFWQTYGEYVDGGAKKLERWHTEGKMHQSILKEAEDEWTSFGYRKEIEEAINMKGSQGIDPSSFLIKAATERFDQYVFAITDEINSPYIDVLPTNWFDKDVTDGWMNYSSTVKSSDDTTTTADSSTAAKAHYYFFAKANYSDTSKNTDIKMEASAVTISCSFKTVMIDYPWMNAVLLRMGGWFLKGDYNMNCISDGTSTQRSTSPAIKNKEMFLPCVPTQMILIKDLSIKCDFSDETKKTLSDVRKGGGGLSMWGFGGGASHSSTTTSDDHKVDTTDEGLTMSGIAIIGYYCAINPPSPGLSGKDYLTAATA